MTQNWVMRAKLVGLRVRNRWLFALDILALPMVVYAGYAIRLEDADLGQYWSGALQFATICVMLAPVIYITLGL